MRPLDPNQDDISILSISVKTPPDPSIWICGSAVLDAPSCAALASLAASGPDGAEALSAARVYGVGGPSVPASA